MATSDNMLYVWSVSTGRLLACSDCPTSGSTPHRFRGAKYDSFVWFAMHSFHQCCRFEANPNYLVTGHMRPGNRRADGESLLTRWRLYDDKTEPVDGLRVVTATQAARDHHTAFAYESVSY